MSSVLHPTGSSYIISNVFSVLKEGCVYRVLINDGTTLKIEEVKEFTVEANHEGYYRLNGFHVDFLSNTVTAPDGKVLQVSKTLWKLLAIFLTNRGTTLTHRVLLTNVWGPEYAGDLQYLRVWIAKLRVLFDSKENDNGFHNGNNKSINERTSIFRNVQGMGYQLMPEPGSEPASTTQQEQVQGETELGD